jgi:riboflavin biosynthesis pyrimidine reductase
VALAPRFDLDPGAKMFRRDGDDDPRPRVYGSEPHESGPLAAVADAIRVPSRDGELDLAAVLSDLASSGVQSVLVEGGGRTIGSFLRAGLADALALFVAPCLLGARGATPLVDLETAAAPEAGRRVVVREIVPLGVDRLILADLEPI